MMTFPGLRPLIRLTKGSSNSLAKILIILFVFAVTSGLVISFFHPSSILAESQSDTDQHLKDLQDQISQLQSQLDEARGQEKTLKSQLDYIDAQAKLSQLKIDEANAQINKLEREIDDLTGRIGRLSTTVDSITQVLLGRIVQTYKYGEIDPIDLLFSSNGFSDLLTRFKYVQVAQANDKKVLYQLQATKATYNDQKNDRESRQQQMLVLKKNLESYQIQLDGQKKSKQELLRITQNNEATYQQKIRLAQQEQAAILAILNGGGNEVADGPIHKSDIIARVIVGPSPCSSGTHLHFEVHQNNSIQDPNNFLSSTSYQYGDSDGGKSEGAINPHGSWDWPFSLPIYISQGYGMTPYAQVGAYGGGPHTGIDMYQGSFVPTQVTAVHDGTLYTGGVTCNGGTLHYKKVDHGDGFSSYYLHVL